MPCQYFVGSEAVVDLPPLRFHSTVSNLAAMNKPLDFVSNDQKYSAVKDEDFEETASEESGTQRAALARERRQSAWHLTARFLISREILAVHLIWLLILILSIFCLRYFTSGMGCAISRLPSDEVFGESAWCQSFAHLIWSFVLLRLQQYLSESSRGRRIWVSLNQIPWMGSAGT